jgi:hypothetical protein
MPGLGPDHDLVASSVQRLAERVPPRDQDRFWRELRQAGWVWPAEDELVIPRPELVALVAATLGRVGVVLPYADAVHCAALLAALGQAPEAVARHPALAEPASVRRARPGLAAELGAVRDEVAGRAARDWALLASCAEVVGIAQRLLDATVSYAQTRRQFGKPIGAFQAVQHRAVDMHVATEEMHALMLATARAWDAPSRPLAVALLHNKCARAGRFVGQGAIQLHGAIAMTDELPVGHAVLAIEAALARHGGAAESTARVQQALRDAPEDESPWG